jgi:hypothetical protein
MSLMVLVMGVIAPLLTFEPIRRANAVEDRLVPLFPSSLSDLERKPESVFEGAAVFVGAAVGERGYVV